MINEKFWLAIAFTSFIMLILKYVWPKISKALDGKSKQIAEEILAAKDMRQRASHLLEEVEKLQKETIIYANNLLKNAEIEAQKFLDEAQKSAETEIAKKTAATIERIKSEEEKAIRELKTNIISTTLRNLDEELADKMDQNQHSHLINQATKSFEATLNK